MSRHANPTMIGAFVLGALALGSIAILLLAGGRWFQQQRQYILYFDGAAQGLQVGAPVVMLGVKVGSVKQIQLGLDPKTHRFLVPVTIELEPNTVKSPTGGEINLQDPNTIHQLIARGLRGRLKVQSFLTGQLYVGLDFYPDKSARFVSHGPSVTEIPTISTTMEELTSKFEGFPMDKFLNDLASISTSINAILSSDAVRSIPKKLDSTLANLEALTEKLDRQGGPLLVAMRTDLSELQKTLTSVQTAVDRVGKAADRLGGAADQVGEAAGAASPLFKHMGSASNELAKAAQKLRDLASDDSPTVQHLNLAVEEIGRSARALRQMAETIEQQPESLLRGKRNEEDQ